MTAPDPLAVIEETMNESARVTNELLSLIRRFQVTRRHLPDRAWSLHLAPGYRALASLKREREERERLREALSKIAWRLTDENYPEHNSLGHDRAYYLKRPDAAYLARFRGVVKETLAIARAALDGEQERDDG